MTHEKIYYNIIVAFLTTIMLFIIISCHEAENTNTQIVDERDSLPVLTTNGISTVISDSGIVKYKIITEDWLVYDKRNPKYWEFNHGLFLEQYNRKHEVEAYISCDTAHYYYEEGKWVLRGHVLAKNTLGETFKTTLLYYNTTTQQFSSPKEMEVDGIERRLTGYDFYANQSFTEYSIRNSSGYFPLED